MRIVWVLLFIASVFIIWFFLKLPGYAHFADRPDLNQWFGSLRSGKGMCCSFADGISIKDVDWSTRDGHYIVKVPATAAFPGSKDYIPVPDAAVVTEPNRYGPAVVWPYFDSSGAIQIRCFMPGALT